jgi:hypothetical protein
MTLEVRGLPYNQSAAFLAQERARKPGLLAVLLRWTMRGVLHPDPLATLSRYTGGRV